MPERRVTAAAVLGLTLAVGIASAGLFVANAIFRARASERSVTVKGFAEREIPADLVLWPVSFVVTAGDLVTLQQRYEASAAQITAFLRPDITPGEYSLTAPRVTDRQAQGFGPENRGIDRFVAEGTVAVRTTKIETARSAMQRSTELVKQGVALVRNYEQPTEYLFTRLDSVKPEMIAEATRDARHAAEQFAQDSGSRVGAIRNAQQGYFSVENRDPFSPEIKKVRVVTTVQYFLEGR